jgi:hypothetical protein
VSSARVLAVVSVDGVNVITGEDADPDQSGYVIEPDATVDIQGWRKDFERTAAFYFTDVGDAYASRTGRPGNLGVIGIAAFRERAVAVMSSPPYEGAENRAAKSETAPSPAANEASGAASSRSDDRSSSGRVTAAANTRPLVRSNLSDSANGPMKFWRSATTVVTDSLRAALCRRRTSPGKVRIHSRGCSASCPIPEHCVCSIAPRWELPAYCRRILRGRAIVRRRRRRAAVRRISPR